MGSLWNICGVVGLLAASQAACDHESVPPPAPPAAAVRVTPSKVTLMAGDATQLSAEVDDALGRPVGGAQISFSSRHSEKLLVSSTGFVQSEGPSGQADVVVSSDGKQTVVPVTITVGAPAAVEAISGDGQSAIVGTPLPQPIVVRVLDDKSNPVSGSDVTFTVADGGVADPPMEATSSSGEARARWTLGSHAGVQNLSASIAGSHTSAAFSADAQSGPPAKLKGSSQPATQGAHDDSDALEVRVTDAQGNAKPGLTVHWRIEAGGGKLSGDSSTTGDDGIAQVSLSLGKRIGQHRIAANVGALVTRIDVGAR